MLPIQAFAADKSAQDANIRSVDFEVELQIQGDTPLEDAMFTFVLEAEDDAPVPESTYATRTGAGYANFGDIEFTHTGVYHYKIYEQNDGIENYVYDDTVYSTDVYVTYDSYGNMVSDIVAYDDTEIQRQAKEPEMLFINEYSDSTPIPGDESTTTPTTTTTKTTAKTDKGDDTETGKSPKTGDYSNMRQWIAVVCIAIVGLVSCVCYLSITKKHSKKEEEL
jgi:pilin isopeptide linkage protein